MCMKPWLLLETEEDRKSSKQNSDFYKIKPDYFYHALTQKIFEKKYLFCPHSLYFGSKEAFPCFRLCHSPKKGFHDSPFSWRKDISLKTTNVDLMLLPVKPVFRCSKYCSWEISVWIKATYWPISEQTDIAIPGVTPQACLKKRSQETTSMSKASIYGSPNRYPLFFSFPSFTPPVVVPHSMWQRSESWITSDNFGGVRGGD